jgi:hypothetical protein
LPSQSQYRRGAAIGPRTVTNCLRVLGLAEHPSFTAFHRVLNRNVWSGLALDRTLLQLLVPVFEPGGHSSSSASIILWNAVAVGASSRPVTSTMPFARQPNKKSPVAVCVGSAQCCWSQAPFAGRIWGLPVLTALTPSKAWCEDHKRRYRPVTEWAERLLLTLHRWLPERVIVAVHIRQTCLPLRR